MFFHFMKYSEFEFGVSFVWIPISFDLIRMLCNNFDFDFNLMFSLGAGFVTLKLTFLAKWAF